MKTTYIFFFCVTRVRNAFTHDKKEHLFEAKQLFLLSVGLAVGRLASVNPIKNWCPKLPRHEDNIGHTFKKKKHRLCNINFRS